MAISEPPGSSSRAKGVRALAIAVWTRLIVVSRWAEAADDVPYIKSIFIKLEADNRTRAVIVGRRLNLVLAD